MVQFASGRQKLMKENVSKPRIRAWNLSGRAFRDFSIYESDRASVRLLRENLAQMFERKPILGSVYLYLLLETI